jgi:beta-xylosidase
MPENIQFPKTWTADNGNGTYSNPLFYDEFSDPDMIRVGDDYYMTGTTMHTMPGLPVLHSKDLVNWELLGYAFDRLDLGSAFRMEDGKEIYGQGIWAPCLRYHNGVFHIFTNINGHNTQHFSAKNPAGPWTRGELNASLHDLSVLFDDDGKIYVIWSYQEIHLAELDENFMVKPGTERIIIPRGSGVGEGSHFLKLNGKYYIFFAVYDPALYMVCARADNPFGPYDVTTISAKESLGIGQGYRMPYHIKEKPYAALSEPNIDAASQVTMHQGAVVDTPTGEWWGFSMADHNSIGRLTCLSPITWVNDWPYFGLPGNLGRTPIIWKKPNTGFTSEPSAPYDRCDDFSGGALKPVWQWNHVPDDTQWSLTERPGFLRLHSLPAMKFWNAKNSLTQRAIGPESIVTVEVDGSSLEQFDAAGIGLLSMPYSVLVVGRENDQLGVYQFNDLTDNLCVEPLEASKVWLRVSCNFDTEKAVYSYSVDGVNFKQFGDEVTMVFQLKTFQGVRFALCCYNIRGDKGGYADFTNFTVDEPRARGLSAPIPVGKIVTIASKADDAVLVVKNGAVSSASPRDPVAKTDASRFRIVDLGFGQIALEALSGGYVTVDAFGGWGDLRIKAPSSSAAQAFQWEDMQHGDIAFLSLSTNRYLRTAPNDAGMVCVDHSAPAPSRLDGAVFVVKE